VTENFVDFKQVKEQVSIEMVLAHYNINLRRSNQHSLRGRCPLPNHSSEKSSESFSVQIVKNIWACQSTSCAATRQGKKGGNVLDLVSIMESCSVRDAALKLRDWFLISTPASESVGKGSRPDKKLVAEKTSETVEVVNPPLSFTLKDIDHQHPYLRSRGLKEATAKTFDVGLFSGRGSMSGRVVIPIHNEGGGLVAYAGRAIDASEPKYKLPAGFKKSAELFNLHRVLALPEKERDTIIVVEGFFDCMKVHQAGLPAVVALMGSSMSDEQQKLLLRFAHVVLFLDGDAAGREATQTIAAQLLPQSFVKVVSLAGDRQPDQLSSEEIRSVFVFQ
jgi:DNA primase